MPTTDIYANEKPSLRFSVTLLLLYSALVILGVIYHEPWRDEAQSWLVARDLNYWQILKQMSYEGSPALWHTILYPFAHLGFSYATQFIIHTVIVLTSASIFIFKSPFSKTTKIVLLFSYYFAFEYAVIARLYSLSILFIFGIASMYRERFNKPIIYSGLILLLFHTTTPVFGVAAALTVMFAFEVWQKKLFNFKNFVAVAIMCAGGIGTYLLLIPAPDNFRYGLFSKFFPLAIFKAISNALIPGIGNQLAQLFYQTPHVWLALVALLIFTSIYFLFAAAYLKNKFSLFFLSATALWLFYVFTFKLEGGIRHHGLLLIVIIFALWIQQEHLPGIDVEYGLLKKVSLLFFTLCLITSIGLTVRSYTREFTGNFSGAKEMAKYIKDNGLKTLPIAAYYSWTGSSLLPYLPETKMWYPGTGDYGSYITWDKTYLSELENMSSKEAVQLTLEKFRNYPVILFLSSEPLENTKEKTISLVHQTHSNVISDENFYLYEITPKTGESK